MSQAPKSLYLKGRRLRLFGGPNGSGKSTIFKLVDKNFDIGYYVNADEIEKQLLSTGYLDLGHFGIEHNKPESFTTFLSQHPLKDKARSVGYNINLVLENGLIHANEISSLSYEAALLADFIRKELIKKGAKLTFESVMSHYSKIETLASANQRGYKTYLYFICTSSPEINIDRVNLRVKTGGHHVEKSRVV
ncbi:MAG: toxin, partial [Bacteroidota bacterium]